MISLFILLLDFIFMEVAYCMQNQSSNAQSLGPFPNRPLSRQSSFSSTTDSFLPGAADPGDSSNLAARQLRYNPTSDQGGFEPLQDFLNRKSSSLQMGTQAMGQTVPSQEAQSMAQILRPQQGPMQTHLQSTGQPALPSVYQMQYQPNGQQNPTLSQMGQSTRPLPNLSSTVNPASGDFANSSSGVNVPYEMWNSLHERVYIQNNKITALQEQLTMVQGSIVPSQEPTDAVKNFLALDEASQKRILRLAAERPNMLWNIVDIFSKISSIVTPFIVLFKKAAAAGARK